MDSAQVPDQNTSDNTDEGGMNPVLAAALVGGAVAATAGAYFGTRALARKNKEKSGRPLNSVLATAITACDLAHDKEPPNVSGPKTEPELKA